MLPIGILDFRGDAIAIKAKDTVLISATVTEACDAVIDNFMETGMDDQAVEREGAEPAETRCFVKLSGGKSGSAEIAARFADAGLQLYLTGGE